MKGRGIGYAFVLYIMYLHTGTIRGDLLMMAAIIYLMDLQPRVASRIEVQPKHPAVLPCS
jgi:hypothetical protein